MSLRLLLPCGLIAVTLAAGLPLAAAADGASATGKGMLGVRGTNPQPQWPGALVTHPTPDSAATHAGLQLQDLIVEADSRLIPSAADLTTYITSRRAGDRIAFAVM